MERDEEECSNTKCELYINKIETKISLHRVSCEDHNHQAVFFSRVTIFFPENFGIVRLNDSVHVDGTGV